MSSKLLALTLVSMAMGSLAKTVSHGGLDLESLNDVQGLLHQGRSFGTDLFTASQKDIKGHTVTKLGEKYMGIPVEHHAVTVRQSGGRVKSVIGTVLSNPPASVEASVDGVKSVLDIYPNAKIISQPEVVIYEHDDFTSLAHKTQVGFTDNNGKAQFGNVYTDATNGRFINFETKKYFGMDRETYRYPEVCTDFYGALDNLPGSLALSDTQGAVTPNDMQANNAHDNSEYVYDFYSKLFDRDSIDGEGMPIVSSVAARLSDYSGNNQPLDNCYGDNAFWLSAPYNQMVYLVDGVLLCNIETGTDVVGHEMSHGVTDHTSELVYEDESGAINEAFSDIMGAGVELWRDNGCTSNPNCTLAPNPNTWLVGEQAICSDNPYGLTALRFMDNPTLDGYSTDNYDDLITGSDDNGGVHGNSGILNLEFFLLSEGGFHPRPEVSTVEVVGVGAHVALELHYVANTALYVPNTGFHMARDYLSEAAAVLYGDRPEYGMIAKAINDSFDAVRVFAEGADACHNGQQDHGEDGVDCGGDCLECPGSSCNMSDECASGMCVDAAGGFECGSNGMPHHARNAHARHHRNAHRNLLFGQTTPCVCA